MACPVCNKQMVGADLGGVHIDVCENGCKGMWFDWNELSKLDEKNEGFGAALKEALQYPRMNDDKRGKINCPKCGIPMVYHKYQSSKEVNVDECYGCGGFFLDSGELQVIRDSFMTEEEEQAYFKKLLNEVPEFKQAQQDLKRETARTEALRHFTRFMRVSYYITGR